MPGKEDAWNKEYFKRVLLAFFVAPASFGLLIFILSIPALVGFIGLALFFLTLAVTYPIAIVFGIPMYFLFKRWNFKRLVTYILFSPVFTVLPIAYFILYPIYNQQGGDLSKLLEPIYIIFTALIVFASILTVTVFWFIARPDKQPE